MSCRTLRRLLPVLGALAACNGSSHSAPADAAPPVDIGPLPGDAEAPGPASVLEEHLHPNRDGAYVQPLVTPQLAASLHVDTSFAGTFDSMTYAELLYIQGLRPSVDAIYVATSSNHVTALDVSNGRQIWDTVLGPTVATFACPERPSPAYGIQSTPVIDPATRTIYVESFQPEPGATAQQTTLVYALSIDDGSIRKGWPVDIGRSVKGFDGSLQHTRAGLALFGGTLYIPFASVFDCMNYHGWVVGISTTDPTKITSWSTTANRGGIWGGIINDGTSLYVTTGNTETETATWGGGEAAIRLSTGLVFSGQTTDYFAPSNWKSMDEEDLDLGSASPVLFDLPGAEPGNLLVAIGKEGVMFLLDRENLGGIGKGDGTTGEGLYSQKLMTGDSVHGRIATYETAKGRYVVFRGNGTSVGCPNGDQGDLVAVRVTPTSPPKFSIAWCATSNGYGSPVVTTTDGRSNPIVWVPASSGVNRLYGFDGDTGHVVYDGGGPGDVMSLVWRWASPVIANGRFYVAGQGQVYAFGGAP
jgi:outer membrane protein assembly factor BamB